MIIETCVVGVTATNCYLLINNITKETVVIDPGAQSSTIILKIDELDLKPVAILLTHGHFDHIMAAKEVAKEYDIEIYAPKSEEAILKDASLNCSNLIRRNFTLTADVLLEDHEVVNLAGIDIETIYTPGHTVGGASYYIEDKEVIFCGDTLFFESIGRTDLPMGDIRSLRHSIVEYIFVLPDDVTVYPGHGATTSIGHEKEYNPYIREYGR